MAPVEVERGGAEVPGEKRHLTEGRSELDPATERGEVADSRE